MAITIKGNRMPPKKAAQHLIVAVLKQGLEQDGTVEDLVDSATPGDWEKIHTQLEVQFERIRKMMGG